MRDSLRDSLADRQNQWRAFEQWRSEREAVPMSLQERVIWYNSAFKISRTLSRPISPEEIQTRIRQIQVVRAGLSHLK